MKRNIELLAPGGDIDSIKAAIIAGADAVYCGLDKFNARNRATNISFDDLNGILRLAHKNNCQVYLTLNIIIVESEIPALIGLLNKIVNTSIDGIIIQDLGLFYLLSYYFKGLKIHASTQLTTHNEGQIRFLGKLNATRVNLSRELDLHQIKTLTSVAHKNNILTEVFVHGSYCISFSGICYLSSIMGGNSGNRGRCSQPCRDQYETTSAGKKFPLNLKDNSAYADLKELYDAGVDALKIEGRIKKFHYVYTVVDAWRKQLQRLYNQDNLNLDKSIFYKVFNRDFSNGFLKGDINATMFIDNPRDHSAIHLSETNGSSTSENLEKAKGDIYNERTGIITTVENQIKQLNITKAPLTISISGKHNQPLKVAVETPDISFVILSDVNLSDAGNEALSYDMILTRLKSLNDTGYYIKKLELNNLSPNVFIPFKELTSIKKRLLFALTGSKETIASIAVPVLKKQYRENSNVSLSVLLSSPQDLYLSKEISATIYFQLPNCLKNECSEFVNLFKENKKIIPWFPSVLMDDDYNAAVEFLEQLQPAYIVTNNTGIAYEAFQKGISWIAGPHLNLVNSFSLLCLKENFNCCGAFISNEISKIQIKGIKKPENFEMYYSIYHPIELMTSRQCLFHQVTGCTKKKIDDACIQQCEKLASITNLKSSTFVIEKSRGNYHHVYHGTNFLNTEIVIDIPDIFSSFVIDLRDIKTETKIEKDKLTVIRHFENLLNGNPDSQKELKRIIHPSTNTQYKRGI
jgi:U32 family peptidase